jgi:ATP-binding cassette subfamily B protein
MAAWCATSVVPALGGLVALVLIDPLLAVAFLVAAPFLVWLGRVLAQRSSTAASRYLEVQGSIGALLVGTLAGARTIAAAASQDREVRRVLDSLPDLRQHGRRMWATQASIAGSSAVTGPLVEVAVLGVAGLLLTRHRISAGELVAASQYVLLAAGLPAPLSFLARFSRARAGAARVAEVTSAPAPKYGPLGLSGPGGRLEFRDVTVRDALVGLSLVVPAGTLMAVVGRSGSGKSTLAALAGRLRDPDEGEVLLDGLPLRLLSRAQLRGAVAYGFDRPELVGETVRDAIALGCPPEYVDRVVPAARAACADEFVRRLPAGYATPMADAPLSGGERQRLGLARAFVRPARLLVLDDATSSLDTATELQISTVLTGQLSERTRIVVAHRARTAAQADLVAWLDGGRVRRVARHDELWQDPDYRRAFAR